MDQKLSFSRETFTVDIYADMDRKGFFSNDLKKRRLRRYVDIFGYMDKKTIISNRSKLVTYHKIFINQQKYL